MILELSLLMTTLVAYRQAMTTFSPSGCQYFTTSWARHSCAESVLVPALSITWLKCTLHCSLL